MTDITLEQIIVNSLKGLGYSDTLIQTATDDLQKIVAAKSYISINERLSKQQKLNLDNPDVEKLIAAIKDEVPQKEIEELLLRTTEEVVSEYLARVSE